MFSSSRGEGAAGGGGDHLERERNGFYYLLHWGDEGSRSGGGGAAGGGEGMFARVLRVVLAGTVYLVVCAGVGGGVYVLHVRQVCAVVNEVVN
jgi:hypothetical protein